MGMKNLAFLPLPAEHPPAMTTAAIPPEPVIVTGISNQDFL
jgi:hypothetical protein